VGTIAEYIDPETGKVVTKNLGVSGPKTTTSTYGTTNNSALASTPSGWLRDPAAAWGTGSDEYYNSVLNRTTTTSSGSSGGGGGGGGGGGSAATSATIRGWFQWYAGEVPGIAATADQANWTEQDVINWCISNGKEGTGLKILRSDMRRIAAPFYNGDPSGIPSSTVDSLIRQGYWQDPDYLTNTYFPALQGVGATNPLAGGYMEVWDQMVGNRAPGSTALGKLNEIIKAYGFTETGLQAWTAFIKTTESAYYGDYGAENRANITSAFNSLLGRNPTAEELAYGSTYWNMASTGSAAALQESVLQSPEGQALYAGKPAWETPAQYMDRLRGIDATLRWYYGDNVSLNDDGSLTINTGAPGFANDMSGMSTGVPSIPTYVRETSAPEWKSLSMSQWQSDLAGYGITYEGGKYFKDGAEVSADNLLSLLPANTYYRDESGFHYIQTEGAIDPRTGKATTGPTVPKTATTAPSTPAPVSGNLFGNLGFTYLTPDMAAKLGNIDGQTLAQQFAWQEEASYMQGIYSDVLTEAFGGSGGIDWYKMASGAKGSGAMRAQLVEAQNRVAYRETYRQIFGTDPNPSDYDRITQQFVSPGEMLREHQAIESADEMYEEVNDLLMRVYGQGVSKDELKDMVLGRTNSGELKALINQATKLDAYTWIHKQYYDTAPTPEDYARYAGFTGPAELQWEIVTHEKVNEMRETVNEALVKAGYDPFTDEELTTMYGEQEGYGDLLSIYRKASKKATEVDQAEDWQYSGAEMVDIGYTRAEQGGFKTSAPGLADL